MAKRILVVGEKPPEAGTTQPPISETATDQTATTFTPINEGPAETWAILAQKSASGFVQQQKDNLL